MSRYSPMPALPQINWKNPITRGLVFCQPCSEKGVRTSSSKVRELVYKVVGNPAAGTNQPATVKHSIGNMLSFDGTSPGPVVSTPLISKQRSTTQASYCVFALRKGAGPSDNGRVFSESGLSDAKTGNQLTDQTFLNRMQFEVPFSTTSGAWSFPQQALNTLHFYVITYDGASVSNVPDCWTDGIKQTATQQQAPVGTQEFHDTNMLLGNISQSGNAFTRTYNGYLGNLCKWNRILTPAEVRRLSTDPWCIYRKSLIQRLPKGPNAFVNIGS